MKQVRDVGLMTAPHTAERLGGQAGYQPRLVSNGPHPRPQIGLWFWYANSAAPLTFLRPLLSCSGELNFSHVCNRELDALMEQAAQATGPEATELWRRVETALADQACRELDGRDGTRRLDDDVELARLDLRPVLGDVHDSIGAERRCELELLGAQPVRDDRRG